jgi:hypothetical protein
MNTGAIQGSTNRPKIFISYSWTTLQHERWVVDLAERLSGDGIAVVLDKWDLKEGQDKHKFMEQMVHDEGIGKVLVICDRGYQLKADDRKGGVGTESQLISKEVYENTGQEKFIPIVREHDEDGKACMPHFMGGRIYIDLSSEETFEENYQKLVRNLYGKPLLKRPPLGTPPAYITDDEQVQFRTTHKILAIKDSLLHARPSANGLISDFLDTFVASLEEFRISGGAVSGFDEKVAQSIEKMLPLRDDFIDFALLLFRYRESVDLDQLHEFWEKLLSFTFRPEAVQSWSEVDFDNYRFFNYELMLSFITVLFRLRRYPDAAHFIHTPYFFRNDTCELKEGGVEMFNRYARSLEEFRNNRLGIQRVSVSADLIKSRATHKEARFDGIYDADLILHFILQLRGGRFDWFPRTSAYGGRFSKIEFFSRLVSRNHFEKVKVLFEVQTVEEFKALVEQCVARNNADHQNYSGLWNFSIPRLENIIDVQNIAATR